MSEAQTPTKPNGNGEHHVPALAEVPDDFLLRIARDQTIDADKMRIAADVFIRLQETQRQWAREEAAERAKRAFLNAKALSQAEYPVIPRATLNDNTGKNYATLDQVWRSCAPIWTAHELVVSFDAPTRPDGQIEVQCIVEHTWGYREIFSAPTAPPDDRGIKGTVNKTIVQGNQAAITFIQRGLVCRAMGIVTADDDDGNSGKKRDQGDKGSDYKEPRLTWQQRLARGDRRESDRLIASFGTQKTSEALESLVDRVRDLVAEAPPDVQQEIAAALAAARKRLKSTAKEKPPADKPAKPTNGFEAILKDAYGEDHDGEIHADPLAFARALLALYHETFPPDVENLLTHNADAIEAARQFPNAAVLLEQLRGTTGEQTTDETRPPDSDESGEDADERWVAERMADIAAIPNTAAGRAHFDTLVSLPVTRTTMAGLKDMKRPLFDRMAAAFNAKNRSLPKAKAGAPA